MSIKTIRHILLSAVVLCSSIAIGQVKLEDIVKSGSILKYGVEAGVVEYDFIVTVKDKRGTSFDWEMTAPANIKGSIIHTKKALAEGYYMWNFFEAGTKKLDDKTLSIWLSQKQFKFLSVDAPPTNVGIYGPGKPVVTMLNAQENDFSVLIDGKMVNIHEREVRPMIRPQEGYIMADTASQIYFTYNNSASFPIILRMRCNFFIYLKSVKTK